MAREDARPTAVAGDKTAQMRVALKEPFGKHSPRMTRGWRFILALALALGGIRGAQAQIDPTRRELVQLGYNQPIEGRGPLAAYGFYYLNRPDFLEHSNLTLRLAGVPVYGILLGAVHYSVYGREDTTKSTFELPDDQLFFNVRAGLRFGGREPVMMPELAMELSAWYEGEFRAFPNRYGYWDDRPVEAHSQMLWARALLNYTTTEWKHNF